jgi:hypothetical protein
VASRVARHPRCREVAHIVETVRTLAEGGVPAGRAVAEGDGPWDVDDRIHNAVRRGYEAIRETALLQGSDGEATHGAKATGQE